jgi:hypothetical protein
MVVAGRRPCPAPVRVRRGSLRGRPAPGHRHRRRGGRSDPGAGRGHRVVRGQRADTRGDDHDRDRRRLRRDADARRRGGCDEGIRGRREGSRGHRRAQRGRGASAPVRPSRHPGRRGRARLRRPSLAPAGAGGTRGTAPDPADAGSGSRPCARARARAVTRGRLGSGAQSDDPGRDAAPGCRSCADRGARDPRRRADACLGTHSCRAVFIRDDRPGTKHARVAPARSPCSAAWRFRR